MATLEDALYARAQAFSGLYALIGGATAPRLVLGQLDENPTLPAISYTRVSRTQFSAFGADVSEKSARIQFSCFANTLTAAKQLATQARAAFGRGFTGTFAGVVIDDAFPQNEIDLPYDTLGRKYGVSYDAVVWYQETP